MRQACAREPEETGGRCCYVRADARTTLEIRVAAVAGHAALYDCVRSRVPGIADITLDLYELEPSLALVPRLAQFRLATARNGMTVHLRNESPELRSLLDAVGISAFFPPVER